MTERSGEASSERSSPRRPSESARRSCPSCGRRFATARLATLHRGEAHPARLDDDEWAEVAAAREAEATELRRLRLKMGLWLVVLYFGFVVLYALVRLSPG